MRMPSMPCEAAANSSLPNGSRPGTMKITSSAISDSTGGIAPPARLHPIGDQLADSPFVCSHRRRPPDLNMSCRARASMASRAAARRLKSWRSPCDCPRSASSLLLAAACHRAGRRSSLHQHHLQSAVAERQGLRQRVRRSRRAGGGLLHLAGAQGRMGPAIRAERGSVQLLGVMPAGRADHRRSLEAAQERGSLSQKTSIFFKRTRIYRLPDKARNVLVYIAVSSKIINGSPANSIDVVPILPWPADVKPSEAFQAVTRFIRTSRRPEAKSVGFAVSLRLARELGNKYRPHRQNDRGKTMASSNDLPGDCIALIILFGAGLRPGDRADSGSSCLRSTKPLDHRRTGGHGRHLPLGKTFVSQLLGRASYGPGRSGCAAG